MKSLKIKYLFLLSLLISSVSLFAQGNDIEMADAIRSSGKIYVVVTCLMVIFIGIIIYLISVDRKISRIEKMQKNTRS